jgi:hypothetical protein
MVVVIFVVPVVAPVIFMIPVPVMHFPALLVVVVMRMAPICTLERWALPVSGYPAIVMTVGSPISTNPHKARTRRRATTLIAERRRRCSDVNRNLTERWNCQSHG